MKIAVASDVHLGDPNSTLIRRDGSLGSRFQAFARAAGDENDYLVLLGDILDFSLAPYAEVYPLARRFFEEIVRREVARELIYIPGNHDFDLWPILEHEVNVIRRIRRGLPPRGFRFAVPGVLDDRPGKDRFVLPDVGPNELASEGGAQGGAGSAADPTGTPADAAADGRDARRSPSPGTRYGDIFLSDLAGPPVAGIHPLPVNVAYPNLYLVSRTGECTLLTHGHYFERYWGLAGEVALAVAGEDLALDDPLRRRPSIREIAAMNFPLTQLASSGLGQAGPLTPVVRAVQREVKDGRLARIERYLRRLDSRLLDPEFGTGAFDPGEWASDAAIHLLRGWTLAQLRELRTARFDRAFLERDGVRRRFVVYLEACLEEMGRLRRLPAGSAVDLPTAIRRVIFGHTHEPMGWEGPHLAETVAGATVEIYNTGGWLTRVRDGMETFVGAAVFRYDSARGFWSEPVE